MSQNGTGDTRTNDKSRQDRPKQNRTIKDRTEQNITAHYSTHSDKKIILNEQHVCCAPTSMKFKKALKSHGFSETSSAMLGTAVL